jgi:peptidoglycan hydrolase CwlO-like protein
VSEARQWVETMQRGVKAVRGALDDHDRLRHEASAIQQDNARLREEIDRSGKELAELDSSITRAIELVNDLRARLQKDPGPAPAPP